MLYEKKITSEDLIRLDLFIWESRSVAHVSDLNLYILNEMMPEK